MKRVIATLVTDGSSDRLLKPLIELLFIEHTDLPYQVNCAEGLAPVAAGLKSRIESALELFPCDFLFLHRDAEGIDSAHRQQEIEKNWLTDVQNTTLICVVPVRMTEAWLLTNPIPIRLAVGNGNGIVPLELPSLKNIEAVPNAKEILFAALKTATMWSAHRKARFVPDRYRHRVSELTDDLMPLRQLTSFNHLEAQVKKHLQALL